MLRVIKKRLKSAVMLKLFLPLGYFLLRILPFGWMQFLYESRNGLT